MRTCCLIIYTGCTFPPWNRGLPAYARLIPDAVEIYDKTHQKRTVGLILEPFRKLLSEKMNDGVLILTLPDMCTSLEGALVSDSHLP